MKLIAAYLLLSLGKESKPTAEDVTKLLSTVGIEADNERLEKLISELDGKDVSLGAIGWCRCCCCSRCWRWWRCRCCSG